MRNRIRFVLLLALLAWVSGSCTSEQSPVPGAAAESPSSTVPPAPVEDLAPLPSILLVLTDDLRADSLSATGHPFIQTPRLDRLAAEGVLFSNSFVITALCCPSRATLLTGLSTHRSGVTNNNVDLDDASTTILPEYLKPAGYTTAFIGKYHLGDRLQPRAGFDDWAAVDAEDREEALLRLPGGETQVSHDTITDVLTDLAVSFLEDHAGERFFLMLAIRSPHIPPEPATRHASLYASRPIELPASFHDDPAGLPESVRQAPARQGLQVWLGKRPDPDTALIDFIRQYARMLPGIDDSIGRLDDTLARLGIRERTALIVTSDNGYLMGEHGLFRKGLPYEPAIRVPLILRVPGLGSGTPPREEQVLNLDLAPTILDLAGVQQPSGMTGRSLLELLRGEGGPWREEWLYIGNHKPGSGPRELAVRTPEWKYVRYREPGIEEQLFDLTRDADERRNLAHHPDHRKTLEEMRERMRALMAREGVPEGWWEPRTSGE